MDKKSSGNSKDTTCPVCGAELLPTLSIKVNDTAVTLYEDMGEVYQCTAPECNLYFLKVNGKLEQVTKLEILRMQKEITELLEAERKAVRAEVFPMAMDSAEKSELGRSLSRLLWLLTTKNVFHRAYSIEELYEACSAMGVNPSDVDNDMIPCVLTWLQEHKD
jgi:hypothetical protein